MICAWKQLLSVLPQEISTQVDPLGREELQELRLRVNAPPEMITGSGSVWLRGVVRQEEVNYIVNAASRYSPWCAATAAQGYITAPGGHRIGICGDAVSCGDDRTGSFQNIRSLSIRVARDYPGISGKIPAAGESVLILGAPGWGKSTLLRDLARNIANERIVCVVDERGELFPEGIARGKRMDVLSGFSKSRGLEMLLRTMGPEYIAMDEITAEEDCASVIGAANCGVRLIATAHASSMRDFEIRNLYRELINRNVFSVIVLLRKDKSYQIERVKS